MESHLVESGETESHLVENEIKRETYLRREDKHTWLQALMKLVQKIAKPLNQDEIEQMRSFLSRLEKPTGTSSLAYSGATHHMTPLPTHFSTYSPCPSNKKYPLPMEPL